MPAPIDDTVRAAIEQAIRDGAGQASCRGIAAAHGVSPGTVRNIARKAGLDGAFGREKTAAATKARQTDMAARRAALAEVMLGKAEHIAGRLDTAYIIVVATKDDVFRETLDEPPLREVKDGMAAVGAAVKAHMDLIRFDTKEATNPAAASLVDRLADMLHLDVGVDERVDDGYPVPLPTPPDDGDGYTAPDMTELSSGTAP